MATETTSCWKTSETLSGLPGLRQGGSYKTVDSISAEFSQSASSSDNTSSMTGDIDMLPDLPERLLEVFDRRINETLIRCEICQENDNQPLITMELNH